MQKKYKCVCVYLHDLYQPAPSFSIICHSSYMHYSWVTDANCPPWHPPPTDMHGGCTQHSHFPLPRWCWCIAVSVAISWATAQARPSQMLSGSTHHWLSWSEYLQWRRFVLIVCHAKVSISLSIPFHMWASLTLSCVPSHMRASGLMSHAQRR